MDAGRRGSPVSSLYERVYEPQGHANKYLMLGWGVPVVIVLVSLAAKFPDYGHGPQYRYCSVYP